MTQAISDVPTLSLGKRQIQDILPHRGPALVIDQVTFHGVKLKHDHGQSYDAIGLVDLAHYDRLFDGHFSTMPILPGHWMLEMVAQVCGVAAACVDSCTGGRLMYLKTIGAADFRHPAKPGDKLMIGVNCMRLSKIQGKFSAKVYNQRGELLVEVEQLRGVKGESV